jgi:hypothetical protein
MRLSFAAIEFAARMSALGHSLQTLFAPVRTNVRYASDSDQIANAAECRLSARSGHIISYDLVPSRSQSPFFAKILGQYPSVVLAEIGRSRFQNRPHFPTGMSF